MTESTGSNWLKPAPTLAFSFTSFFKDVTADAAASCPAFSADASSSLAAGGAPPSLPSSDMRSNVPRGAAARHSGRSAETCWTREECRAGPVWDAVEHERRWQRQRLGGDVSWRTDAAGVERGHAVRASGRRFTAGTRAQTDLAESVALIDQRAGVHVEGARTRSEAHEQYAAHHLLLYTSGVFVSSHVLL